MTNPSFFVPLLEERDTKKFEQLFAAFLEQNSEEKRWGMVKMEVPFEEEVLFFSCKKLLMLTTERCEQLLAEVPEIHRGTDEHTALVRHVYSPALLARPVQERSAVYMIALINAVLTKYNEGLI